MDKQTRSALCPANVFLCLLIFLCLVTHTGYGETPKHVPDILKPWQSWVLHGKEFYACPRPYDNPDEFLCVWPELLDLEVDDHGGRFKQKIIVFKDGYIPLPGDATTFPLAVTVDGKPTPVLSRQKEPQVFLNTGEHTLTGSFTWDTLPTFFPIPAHTALVSLRINGDLQPSPSMDSENRLWLSPRESKDRTDAPKNVNSLRVSVFRLLEDGHPMTLTTRLDLVVSGEKRRERIVFSLPDKVKTTAMTSPLPAKLMEGGILSVDVKAGTWTVTVLGVINEPVATLGPIHAPHGEELWSFKPVSHVRVAHIDDVSPIDPMQSNLPDAWKHFSTYRITEGDRLTFVETQRGCSGQGQDQIFLNRDLWLDFDGKGATVSDTLTGSLGMRRAVFLDDQAYQLGRVTLNGKDRLISGSGHFKQGLEVERGPLNLRAVSRIKTMPSGKALGLGWNNDYQSADLTLHLPPGWSLWGIDGGKAEKNSTWLSQWSLPDLLLILLAAYAAFRLWNIAWGLVFFFGLLLIANEHLAPFYLFALLPLITALARFKFGSGVSLSKPFSIINTFLLAALVCHTIVFCVSEAKTAFYPQLEPMGPSFSRVDLFGGCAKKKFETATAPMALMEAMDEDTESEDTTRNYLPPAPMKRTKAAPQTFRVSSENLATQTGPAVPQWQWHDVGISLGRVPSSHIMRFWLASPIQNAFVSAVSLLFVIMMLGRIVPFRSSDRTRYRNRHETLAILIGIIIAGSMGAMPSPSFGEIPSPQLLEELEHRLTQADECFPDCATLTDVALVLPEEQADNGKSFIKIDMTVNAAIETAIPLPSGQSTWSVYDMTLDDSSHLSATRQAGVLWTLIPPGVHRLSIRGTTHTADTVSVSFPVKPAMIRVSGPSWEISGLDRNRQTEHTLTATRKVKKAPVSPDTPQELPEQPLSDFVCVERVLSLDREWSVVTSVERLEGTDDRRNVTVHLPLLKDEHIRTDIPNLNVSGGVAQISLVPGSQRLSWVSDLPITPSLDLSVPQDASWSETWKLELSTLWNLSAQGPPRICKDGTRSSLWYPWPGETVHLAFTRLEPAQGSYFTIDSVSVDYHVDKGSNRLIFQSDIRTSQGKTLRIPTPEGCIVKHVRINNRPLPFSGRPDNVDLSLPPGRQSLFIEWDQAETWEASWIERYLKPEILSVPEIDLGLPAANITTRMHLPARSWVVYTHGPVLGPALTSWGLCLVILFLSPFLARLPLSPLKTRTWAILGIGLVSLSVPQVLMVAGWFFILEFRKTTSPVSPLLFNIMQLVLLTWTLCVLIIIYAAVHKGLLHIPDMRIIGNGSSSGLLVWTQDKVSGVLPKPWISLYSAQTYHFFMMLWALWLVAHVLSWSRFAVSALSADGVFRPFLFSRGKRRMK